MLLIEKKFDDAVKNLHLLRYSGFTETPVHFANEKQEALRV